MIYLGWGNSAHTLGAQVYDWREELKEYNSTHTPSARVYDWREELTEQARGRNMGSGASAVLVRRQLAAHATTSSPQPDTPVTDTGRKRAHTAVETGAPSADWCRAKRRCGNTGPCTRWRRRGSGRERTRETVRTPLAHWMSPRVIWKKPTARHTQERLGKGEYGGERWTGYLRSTRCRAREWSVYLVCGGDRRRPLATAS